MHHTVFFLGILWGGAATAQRQVTVLLDSEPLAMWIDAAPSEEEAYLPQHAQLHIAGTDNDGPVRIQVLFDFTDNLHYVDMIDFDVGFSKPIGMNAGEGRLRTAYAVGTTEVTNAELLDVENQGEGIIRDVWTDPNGIFRGDYNALDGGCMRFVQTMLTGGHLGPNVASLPELDTMMDLFKDFTNDYYNEAGLPPFIRRDIALRHRLIVDDDPMHNIIRIYPVNSNDPGTPLPPRPPYQRSDVNMYQDMYDSPIGDHLPINTPTEEQWFSEYFQVSEMASSDELREGTPRDDYLGDEDSPPRSCGAEKRNAYDETYSGMMMRRGKTRGLSAVQVERRQCRDGYSKVQDVTDISLGRVKGVLSTIAMASKTAIVTAGVAGVTVGVAFIILDFVEGQWKGAALGATGLALGVAVGFADSGPLGWAIGGLITVLFAILPRLWEHQKTKPKKNNITQIIQYQMFGDASHTGNEECQKQNPNCTAAYGPGTIALSFDWDYFDAVVFLVEYNKGYPMTIPDMATSFEFNGTETPTAAASMHCDGPARNENAWSQLSNLEDPDICYNPKFYLKRDLVTLPNINQTASQIYNRIIPNAGGGGDCKLLDPSSDPVSFPLYNITVTGMPVSIACNITPAIDVSGIAYPLAGSPPSPSSLPLGTDASLTPDDPESLNNSQVHTTHNTTNKNTNAPLSSPANASTNNIAGAYTAPPPPAPFRPPFNATNSACLTGPSTNITPLCLPNGTYPPQTGLFVNSSTASINSLTLPRGISLTLTFLTAQSVRGGGHATVRTYAGPGVWNATRDADLYWDFKHFDKHGNDGRMDVVVDERVVPEMPAACFFSAKEFAGQVFCLGVGGGDLPGGMAGAAMSVRLFGRVTVYVFSTAYADGSEMVLKDDVPDLSTEGYGTDEDWAGKVRAVWVRGVGGGDGA